MAKRIEAEDWTDGTLSLVFVGEGGSMDQVLLSPEEQDELARILAERAAQRLADSRAQPPSSPP